MEAGGCLNAGTSVRAYYDMNDHPMGYRYVKMLEMPRDGPADVSDPPVVGVSQGWIPATVVEDYDPKQNGEAGVLVKLHGFFEDAYREEKPVSGMMWKVQPNLISLRSSPPVKIQLSLLVVRWKEYFTRTTTSRSHNILNEGLIRDVLAGEASCKEVFGKSGAYEVISVFASTGRHLDAVPRELLASSLRGSRKAALFFLWPTLKKGVVEQGHVDAAAMKSLMTGMEGLGVKTCWPHPWSLYEDLVSKQWAPRDCSRLELRIPPTTSVSCKSLREAGVEAVASSAIAELQRLSRERGRTPLSQEQYRGVAKLTYSWMGVAVLPFVGEESLQRALEKLLDGMPDIAQCLVQEFAANSEWDASFALASHKTLTKEELVMQKFSGNRKTVDQIEEEVRRTASTWLERFKLEGCAPHVIRMDFLVSAPADLADIDENIEAEVAGDAPGRDGFQPATSSRSPPASSPKSGGSRRMSQDEQTSMHAAADEALMRAIAQASAGLSMDASCTEENESVQEGLPSVSVSKLPSAVTVAGVPVATTGDLVYLGGGLYAAAAPAEKPAKKQSAAPARPRPRKPPSAIRSASAHIVGNGARADGDSSPQSRAQSEGQIGVGNLNPDGRGSSRHGSVSGSTSVGSAPGARIWRPSGVQKLPAAKLEPPSGFGGRASRLTAEDIGKMPGDHSEDRASNRRLHGKEGVLLFGPNGVLAHMRDPEHRHQAMLPPSGPPQGIERRLEERKAAKQARINEILEEKALREATEAAISMQKRQNLAAMARNASTPEMSEDLDRKRTRLACKMDILDFFRGYRKAVHKLTADQQKVLQANLHGSALTQLWCAWMQDSVLEKSLFFQTASENARAEPTWGAMATTDKYDRQLRLWGAHGQRALMDAKVCMLGSSAIATESLKNLVLPGIGQFTIVDNAKVEAADLGHNFFLEEADLGKLRSEAACKWLLEMNPDVQGAHVDQDPAKAVAQGKDFFRHFSLVIASQVTELVAAQLGRLCEELQIPLVLITSLGFVGKIRLFVTEHCVCETKPDSEFGDLRLTDPFPELRRFADSIDFASLNDTEHAHVPYVVILIRALDSWRKRSEGRTLPKTSPEKDEFKDIVLKMRRSQQEVNFDEALANAYKAWMPYVIPDAAQQVLSHVANASKSDFWIVARAVSQFVRDCGKLPLAGSLPDMTASTDMFIKLQD
ncbi:nae1 [Symbiodinium microadriaticum]|nr:nae1 [Symbiodinium microadriaticum]